MHYILLSQDETNNTADHEPVLHGEYARSLPMADAAEAPIPHAVGMIEVTNLTKAYGANLAVDDLSFTVRPGIERFDGTQTGPVVLPLAEVPKFHLDLVQSFLKGALDAEGEPAANVPVQVVERQDDGSVRPHETTTDASGFFEVQGLAPGEYYVKAGPGNPWDDSGAPSLRLTAGEVFEVPELVLR